MFNEKFSLYGAMYRGLNPQGKLNVVSKDEVLALRTRTTQMSFEKIALDIKTSLKGKPSLKIHTSVNNKEVG